MKLLPLLIFLGLISLFGVFFVPQKALALTIASQTESYSDELASWQALQELGNSLSGTASSFTFRISTSVTNLNQFDYTAQNTRIYDKDNGNSYIAGCIPSGASGSDPLRGLTFSTTGVPSGYEDVTIDFSCRNYNFVSGHRYLIRITNANLPHYGGKTIRFAAAAYGPGRNGGSDRFTNGGLRYPNGNPWDYSHNSGSCNAITYIWGDPTINPASGCNIWTTARDDLYFVLSNTTPSPTPTPTPAPTPTVRFPVIFIPGIGGSEFQASQDIIWSNPDGHEGTYSHAYTNGEKIWVNETEAAMPGDDDYFDVLRLKEDGQTPEALLSLTGNLTSFGYSDIDSFFEEIGYTKGTNFFVFPYDWRKDIRTTQDNLDDLVEEAKTSSGQPKVNIVAHSMGGLVARNYISDSSKAVKVNKLIELGVPHLGSVDALKVIMYGKPLGRQILGDFYLGVTASEVKDIAQNLPSMFQLLPSNQYFNFYNNSTYLPYPFYDERDIDSNNTTGALSFNQIKTLLTNLTFNMTVFNIGEAFHTTFDSSLNQSNGVNIYEIVGTSMPTLGQIKETWWIRWPVNLINKYEEIYINGDNTVPAYSASLKSDSLDLSGGATIYYVEQKHSDLVNKTGAAMETVETILLEGDTLPVEVKSEKIALEGEHISVDHDADLDLYDISGNHTGLNSDGELEINIPGTFYDTLGNTKHAFIKKNSATVTVKVKSSRSSATNIKKRTYRNDQITKTATYQNVSLTPTTILEATLDPQSSLSPAFSGNAQIITTTSEVTGSSASDLIPPSTSYSISGTTITLTSTDTGSGILKTEYSLDNGQTVQTYTNPFQITSPGTTTIQFFSTDVLGNQEYPQTLTITPTTPTPTPAPTSTNSTSISNTPGESKPTPGVNSAIFKVIAPDSSPSGQILGLSLTTPISLTPPTSPTKQYQSSIWPLPWFLLFPPLLLVAISFGVVGVSSILKRGAVYKTGEDMDHPKPNKNIRNNHKERRNIWSR